MDWHPDDLRRYDHRVYPSYHVTVVTPAAEEPVTLDEAKAHCRVEITADDSLITALIVAARQVVETLTKRCLVTTTFDLTLEYFPPGPALQQSSGRIRIPNPPLQSVTTLKYYDSEGTLATWDASNYRVLAGTPGSIVPVYNEDWPTIREQPEAVVVRYVAGYGDAEDVPQSLKQAVLLLVGHWYENREAANVNAAATELPLAVKALCDSEAWGALS